MITLNQKKLAQSITHISEMAEQEIIWMLEAITNQPATTLLHCQHIELNAQAHQQLMDWISRRQQHEPLAYLLGSQPFYGLDIQINHHTLIPRSSTECMVDWLLQTWPTTNQTVADLGTGSGAIAAALAHHRPQWKIVASDISHEALAVAEKNLHPYPNIQCITSHWLDLFGKEYYDSFDLIVSNPPYIDPNDPSYKGPDLAHEPSQALYSKQSGLNDLFIIIETARKYLKPNGYLVLEHGSNQASDVRQCLQMKQYKNINSHQDNSGHTRWISASWKGE